ncbi:MAG: 3-oxoacyl-[acyl-carrier-protein] synthase III C-terminal domain-containing protein [Pseudorhodobacter sp.]
MTVRISGTGRALPDRRLLTRDIERDLGLAPGRLERATGVVARHVCGSEDQVSMGVAAARAALADAGLEAGEIDTVICGAAVPYQPIPATAPLVMRGLGMADGAAGAFDVNSTCLSFVTAFETAARQIAAGAADHVLVVSSEVASRALPWASDPETAALFGDGAGAAVLSRAGDGEPCGVVASLLRSYPSAYAACGIGAGGTRFDFVTQAQEFAEHSLFAMDGKALFRLAAQHFGGFVAELLDRAGWRPGEVDLVVPHQASPAGLAHMIRLTGFAPDRVVNIATSHGNQIAASIPFALDMARREGRVWPGARVLMLGTSAGVSFGGLALVA